MGTFNTPHQEAIFAMLSWYNSLINKYQGNPAVLAMLRADLSHIRIYLHRR